MILGSKKCRYRHRSANNTSITLQPVCPCGPHVGYIWAANMGPYGLQVGFDWVSGGAQLGETHVGPICLPIWGLSGIRMVLKWGPFSQPCEAHVGTMFLKQYGAHAICPCLLSPTYIRYGAHGPTQYPHSPHLIHVGATQTCWLGTEEDNRSKLSRM